MASKSSPFPEVYEFNSEKRGLCIIFNNVIFQTKEPRISSQHDAKALEEVFTSLEFKVEVCNDLTRDMMVKELRKAQKYDHKEADCFVCIMLSHGGQEDGQDYVFGTHGKQMFIKEALGHFSDKYCPGLKGKPRLFFIQACRGSGKDIGVDIKLQSTACSPGKKTGSQGAESMNDTSDINLLEEQETEIDTQIKSDLKLDPKKLLPYYMDSMVMFASPPGQYAFLQFDGSVFMKALVKALKDWKNKDLMKMLTNVAYNVAMGYKSTAKGLIGCKVVPSICSSLTKDVIFTLK